MTNTLPKLKTINAEILGTVTLDELIAEELSKGEAYLVNL